MYVVHAACLKPNDVKDPGYRCPFEGVLIIPLSIQQLLSISNTYGSECYLLLLLSL